jgi:iron complex transport system substrate-binding protein
VKVAGSRLAVALAVVALAAGAAGCGLAADAPARAAGGSDCRGPATAVARAELTPITPRPKPALPVTVTDFTGEHVTVRDVDRILALDSYGTLGTTVYALGLGNRLVGRDVSTGIPALRDLPLVTHNGHELNAEAILELYPSVVLTDYSIGPLEVQLQLKDAGIPVVILEDARSRERIAPQIEAVAEVLGVPDAGRALVERTEAEIREAEEEVARLAPSDPDDRIRMVFLYLRGNAGVYYWFGRDSGADDLIASLRGVDVATEVGLKGMRPIDAEGLVKAQPEMFLMMSDGLESVGGVEGLTEVAGIADTTAGRTGCVVDMSDFEILSFGPQFPATLRALARAVYSTQGS